MTWIVACYNQKPSKGGFAWKVLIAYRLYLIFNLYLLTLNLHIAGNAWCTRFQKIHQASFVYQKEPDKFLENCQKDVLLRRGYFFRSPEKSWWPPDTPAKPSEENCLVTCVPSLESNLMAKNWPADYFRWKHYLQLNCWTSGGATELPWRTQSLLRLVFKLSGIVNPPVDTSLFTSFALLKWALLCCSE